MKKQTKKVTTKSLKSPSKKATKKKVSGTAKPKPVSLGPIGPQKVRVKIVPQDPSLIPQYQTAGAACCDLVANIPPDDNGNRMIRVNHRAVARVDCGFVMEIPPGYKACVAARSGWASRGLIVTNGPGQIDSDYRDWVKVIVCNVGPENPIVIKHGDRIGQMWLEEVVQIEWEVTDKVSETDRKGGFGSTGGM